MIVGDGQEYTGPPREEYTIFLRGCDSSTVLTLDLYPHEVETLEKVARMSGPGSLFACQPHLTIEKRPS